VKVVHTESVWDEFGEGKSRGEGRCLDQKIKGREAIDVEKIQGKEVEQGKRLRPDESVTIHRKWPDQGDWLLN